MLERKLPMRLARRRFVKRGQGDRGIELAFIQLGHRLASLRRSIERDRCHAAGD